MKAGDSCSEIGSRGIPDLGSGHGESIGYKYGAGYEHSMTKSGVNSEMESRATGLRVSGPMEGGDHRPEGCNEEGGEDAGPWLELEPS